MNGCASVAVSSSRLCWVTSVELPEVGIGTAVLRRPYAASRLRVVFRGLRSVRLLPREARRGCFLFFYAATADSSYDDKAVGLQHLAFMMKTRADVDRVHKLALTIGNEVLHSPREFPDYPPPFYATFWRDPHGIRLEAVCHYDR